MSTLAAPRPLPAASTQASSGVVIHQYTNTIRGQLIRRYKRFLADVVLPAGDRANGSGGCNNSDGRGDAEASALEASGPSSSVEGSTNDLRDGVTVTCYCPNTGPMTGLLDWPLSLVVCSVSSAPGRKYTHTLEMIQAGPGGAWVGVHSALANQLVSELLKRRLLSQLGEWREMAREVPYGSRGSRVDFVLTRPTGRQVFVEVKSVTMVEPYKPSAVSAIAAATTAATLTLPSSQPLHDAVQPSNPTGAATASATVPPELPPPPPRIALFPDTVSERARRHVVDLMEAVSQGHEAVCVFVIQRDDCALFAPCAAKDPVYARLVREAAAAGVQMIALRTSILPSNAANAATTALNVTSAAPASIVFLGLAEVDLEYGSSTDHGNTGGDVTAPAAKTKRGREATGKDSRSDKTGVKRRPKSK